MNETMAQRRRNRVEILAVRSIFVSLKCGSNNGLIGQRSLQLGVGVQIGGKEICQKVEVITFKPI